jgi:hypothetical protein
MSISEFTLDENKSEATRMLQYSNTIVGMIYCCAMLRNPRIKILTQLSDNDPRRIGRGYSDVICDIIIN